MIKLSKSLFLWAVFLIPYEYIYEYLTGGSELLFFKPYRILILLSSISILASSKSKYLSLIKIFNNLNGFSYLFYIAFPILTSSILQISGNIDFSVFRNSILLMTICILYFLQLIYFSLNDNFISFLRSVYKYLFFGFISSSIIGFIISNYSSIYEYRFAGLMNNANHLAFIAGFFLISCFTYPFKLKNNREKNILFVGLPSLIVIINAGSRSALVTALFSIFIYQIISILKTKNVPIKIILFTITLISFVILLDGQTFLGNISNSKVADRFSIERILDIGESGRLATFATAFNAYSANPVIGIGLGNMVVKSSQYINSDIIALLKSNLREYDLTAHNEYLRTLAEGGILTAISLIIFILTSLNFLLRDIFNKDESISLNTQYILSLLIYNLVFALTQDQINFVSYYLINGLVIVYIYLLNMSKRKVINQ